MSTQIVKQAFGEKNEEINNRPLLYRQVATIITFDENFREISNATREINEYYRHQAYLKQCLKMCLKKHNDYKKTYYSAKMFERIMKNKFPCEIFLVIFIYL